MDFLDNCDASSGWRSIPIGWCRHAQPGRGRVPDDNVEFALGGFELAELQPVLVRAFNVLRQYPVDAVPDAWSRMQAQLAPGGLIVDGTCDEPQ